MTLSIPENELSPAKFRTLNIFNGQSRLASRIARSPYFNCPSEKAAGTGGGRRRSGPPFTALSPGYVFYGAGFTSRPLSLRKIWLGARKGSASGLSVLPSGETRRNFCKFTRLSVADQHLAEDATFSRFGVNLSSLLLAVNAPPKMFTLAGLIFGTHPSPEHAKSSVQPYWSVDDDKIYPRTIAFLPDSFSACDRRG